jgi:uncharacterized protein (DUF58 family)
VASDPRIQTDLAHLTGLEARARGFDFLPRQPVGSALAGRRASRLRGRGLDFEELRAYSPGDDVRAIDWKVTARTGSPHVRVTREERDRPALVLVDQRMSMFYGTVLNMKSVTAAEIAALAAWRILGQGDRVGGLVLADRGCEMVPARRSRGAVLRLLDRVADANLALSAEAAVVPDAGTRLDSALAYAAEIVTHDWLLLVVSDFEGAGEATLAILSRIARGNDVVLALVHDPSAREIPDRGRVVVGDGRLQVELDLADARVRRNLVATGPGRIATLLAWRQHLDAAILPVSAGEPTIPQLLRLFGVQPAGPARGA